MSKPSEPLTVHASHLLNRTAPFCEKCAARGATLEAPCPIGDDAFDVAIRIRRDAEVRNG